MLGMLNALRANARAYARKRDRDTSARVTYARAYVRALNAFNAFNIILKTESYEERPLNMWVQHPQHCCKWGHEMICACEICRPQDPASTYTRAYLLECEARFVLAMPLAARRAYLGEIERRGGAGRRERLQAEMARLFYAARETGDAWTR